MGLRDLALCDLAGMYVGGNMVRDGQWPLIVGLLQCWLESGSIAGCDISRDSLETWSFSFSKSIDTFTPRIGDMFHINQFEKYFFDPCPTSFVSWDPTNFPNPSFENKACGLVFTFQSHPSKLLSPPSQPAPQTPFLPQKSFLCKTDSCIWKQFALKGFQHFTVFVVLLSLSQR